jgi:hypothetical protein
MADTAESIRGKLEAALAVLESVQDWKSSQLSREQAKEASYWIVQAIDNVGKES